MHQIEKDILLLREQGYDPYLWLEYVQATPQGSQECFYFDGYVQIPCTKFPLYNAKQLMFIRVSDLDHFNLDSLYILRETNKARYRELTEKGKRGRRVLDCKDEDCLQDFFTLYWQIKQGLRFKSELGFTLTRDTLKTKSRTISYKKAMIHLHKRISDALEKGNQGYKSTKTGVYYKETNTISDLKQKEPNKTFTPTKIIIRSPDLLYNKDTVTLVDPKIKIGYFLEKIMQY